jgi:sialate O-acetylesterase
VNDLREAGEIVGGPGDPLVRHFFVRESIAVEPQLEVSGAWVSCQGEGAGECSAVAYYFARLIRQEIGLAVGLLINGLGDTEAATWMPREALDEKASYRHIAERIPKGLPATARPQPATDEPNRGEPLGWASPQEDDHSWPQMRLPGAWQLQGLEQSGCVWFRRTVEIPAEWAGRDLVLELGALDDHDTTYFNGTVVGKTADETPNSYIFPRVYRVQGHLVVPGNAVIALRIFDYAGMGGVTARADQMKLFPSGEPAWTLPLSGLWKYRVERELPWLWSQSPLPTLLYNAMLHPLARFPIQGVLWYQGESDRIRAALYPEILGDMVAAWRALWGEAFPFFIVQLANFMPRQPEPEESLWAEMREAQRNCAERIPNAELAVAIDVGEEGSVHPSDKKTVGERLARLALAKTYGRCIAYSGPRYSGYTVEKGLIRLRFEYGAGLRARGEMEGFAIAAEDRTFRWGKAVIDGETVVVSHPEIANPKAVRYGWQDNPPSPLENVAGLPASPFRTDDWPLLTERLRR